MYSLFTHQDAEVVVGEVFEFTKLFWSLRGKQCCSQTDLYFLVCRAYVILKQEFSFPLKKPFVPYNLTEEVAI